MRAEGLGTPRLGKSHWAGVKPDHWRALIRPFGGEEFVAAEFQYEGAAREFLWCVINQINGTEHKVMFMELHCSDNIRQK